MDNDKYRCNICSKCIRGAGMNPRGCQHNYHQKCILTWMTSSENHRNVNTTHEDNLSGHQKCPTCRCKITSLDVIYLQRPHNGYPEFSADEDEEEQPEVPQSAGDDADDDLMIVNVLPFNPNRARTGMAGRRSIWARRELPPPPSLALESRAGSGAAPLSIAPADTPIPIATNSSSAAVNNVNPGSQLIAVHQLPALEVNALSSTEGINSTIATVQDTQPPKRKRNDPLVCEYCGKRFNKQPSKCNHIQAHHKPVNKECPVCKKVFKATKNLNAHKKLKNHYAKD